MLASIVIAKPAIRGCSRLEPKRQVVESGLSNVARRVLTEPSVYESRPKSIPYRMQNMETLYLRATPFVAAPTARQGSGASIEKTEEANAGL
jgi:hypothetical protein